MARISFLLDEHVPHAVAQALNRRKIDVLTANEAGLLGAPDMDYLTHSLNTGRVVVTHDSDFLYLHRQHAHAGIAYCEQGTRSIGQVVAGLVLIYEVLEPHEMAHRVEFL